MAFPTCGVLDNFDRADGAIGAAWTNGVFGESTTFSVATNRAAASGSFNTTRWNAGQFGPDSEVYGTVAVSPANTDFTYMGLRTQSPGSGAADCYELVHVQASGNDTINMYRVDNGAQTLLGAAFTCNVAAGDSYGLEVIGTTLTLYYKAAAGSWTSQGTRTDATYSTGWIFMGLETTTPRWDDFGGGTVVVAAAVTPPLLLPQPLQVRMLRAF